MQIDASQSDVRKNAKRFVPAAYGSGQERLNEPSFSHVLL